MSERKATIDDKERMCNSYRDCEDCPMYEVSNNYGITCEYCLVEQPQKAIEVILKWIDEHPVKTRQSELLKISPNVSLNEGCVTICPACIEGILEFKCLPLCIDCLKEYWSEEIGDNK